MTAASEKTKQKTEKKNAKSAAQMHIGTVVWSSRRNQVDCGAAAGWIFSFPSYLSNLSVPPGRPC